MGETGSDRIALAAGIVLVATFSLGFTDNLVRIIADTSGIWQFHMTRSMMALPVVVVAALLLGRRLWPRRPLRVLARTFFNAVAMFLYFGCLALLPVGEVVAGLYTAPIFVLVISALLFGERISAWQAVAVAIGFLGILMILRVDQLSVSLGSAVPVLAGFFYALGNVVTRRWCAAEETLTLLASFFVFMGVGGAVGLAALTFWPAEVPEAAAGFILRGWVAPDASLLFWTLVNATGSIVGVGLIIRAYQLAEASRVAVFENALLIFAAGWAFFLWDEMPEPVALAGMAMIGGAAAIIALKGR